MTLPWLLLPVVIFRSGQPIQNVRKEQVMPYNLARIFFYLFELQINLGFSGLKYNYYGKYNVTCGTLSLWLVTLTPYSLKGLRQKEPYLPFLNWICIILLYLLVFFILLCCFFVNIQFTLFCRICKFVVIYAFFG